MKKLSDFILIAFISLLVFASCEDQELDVVGITPSIKVKFINQDSLDKINTELTNVNTSVSTINSRVTAINQLIEDGDLTDFSEELDSLETEKTALTKIKSTLNENKSTITSGKLFIDKIEGSGSISELTFEDSLSDYDLPLNVNADISDFLITIKSKQYGVTFSYIRDTLIQENLITVVANNVRLMDTTNLKNISFPCDTLNCKSYEAAAVIYF